MKVALITDQHFGARNDSIIFSKYFEKFYSQQFFPYLLENNIDSIIDLGDTFDRRKYINFQSLYNCRSYWFDQIEKYNMTLHCIVGNHCTYYKNTNSVNSPELLLQDYNNIKIYSKCTEITLDQLDIVMIPWICADNFSETMKIIDSTKSQVVMGHLEISGFEMYRGSACEEGYDRKIFDKFDIVMSGHFHHKSSYGNIHYLGAPYEMTWSDWNDPRGFHIFDTDTRELTYIENRFKMFNKIHYDDSSNNLDQILDIDTDGLSGHIVKVIVHEKNNPYWFDMFISKIEKSGVFDLQVVEDNFNLNLEDDDSITEGVEDTLTILNKYTDQFKDRVNINKLRGFLSDLYHEALTVE